MGPSPQVLRRNGRVLTCGATAGYDPEEDLRLIWTFEFNIVGSNGWSRDDIEALVDLVRGARVRPALHPMRFAIGNAASALALLDDRKAFGKVIVQPSSS